MPARTYQTFIETVADAEPVAAWQGGPRVIRGRVVRVRRRHSVVLVEAPASEEVPVEAVSRPSRGAVLLALAHRIQDAIDRGDFRNRAEAARHFGVTRARITQLLRLTLLPVGEQERILFLETVGNRLTGADATH